MKRKIAAIVAADVAGYSRLVAEDEEATIGRLAAYRDIYDDIVRQYGGRIFNTAGDSVLSEFESAVEAVRAAIDIQEALRTQNLDVPQNRKLQFRIGISIGDVIERNGDLLGDGVNIAARLEGLAEPGGICVSRSVHEAVANKISVPFHYLGERQVKNIPQPIHAFQVGRPGEAEEHAPARADTHGRRRWLIPASIGALIVLGGIAAISIRLQPSPEPPASGRPGTAQPIDADRSSQPRTAADLYHDARLFENRGQFGEARKAYDAVERLGLDVIDPGLRYAAMLRVQDGRASARETFAEVVRDRPTPAAALVHALQFDGAERQSRVAALVAAHPDFPPGAHLLADEMSEDRLGRAPTIAERALALDAERRFLKADADGALSAHFLDLSVLGEWLERARSREQTLARTGNDRPTAQFMRSNAGWTASIALPEPALALAYRVGDSGGFTAARDGPALDQRTGRPFPDGTVSMPGDQGPASLWVRYTDAAGHETEPHAIGFDPHAALVDTQRRSLELTSGAWLAFRPDWDTLLYFTQLVSFRCAIRQVRIGLDDAPVERVLSLPACDQSDPYAIPADTKPYLVIPKATRSVSVRLTYLDGTQSDIKTIRR